MEKSKENAGEFLVFQDFDCSKMKDLNFKTNFLKCPKLSKIMNVQRGDILSCSKSEKYKWWMTLYKKFKCEDGREVEIQGKVPSSILIPIIYNPANKDYLNLNDEEKIKIIPNINSKVRKYFPLIYIYYENLITHEVCRKPTYNIFSLIFYGWMTYYIRLGYQRCLIHGDLWFPKTRESSAHNINKFTTIFQKRINNYNDINDDCKKSTEKKFTYFPLFSTFLLTYKIEFIKALILKIFQDIIKFFVPPLIKLLIAYSRVANKNNLWQGLTYSVLLFLINAMNSLLLNKYYEYVYLLAGNCRAILISMTYRKMLKIKPTYFSNHPLGNQINLISTDSLKIQSAILEVNFIWSAPFQIILSLTYLWLELKVAAIPGVCAMILIIPVNYVIAIGVRNFQAKGLKLKDKRIRLISGLLNGIKLVKFYAWENTFFQYISDIRKIELRNISLIRILNGLFYAIASLAPVLISLSTFSTYVYLNGVLSADTAFSALSIFNILRFPLMVLPEIVSLLISASVSYKRFVEFLTLPEPFDNDPNYNQSATIECDKSLLKISNAAFSVSSSEPPLLKNINLHIKCGELHGIIGANGAGKTFLMESIINNMYIKTGTVELVGKIAYVPQQPWISNMTLRDNILSDMPFDSEKYKNVIRICELSSDITLLPNSDLTEIGEKGTNLSGGQKQRVALARAVYSDSDIYLFDDPLCSIDNKIGMDIFTNVISNQGELNNKIRLFISHNDNFLEMMDIIHILNDGKFIFSGTYDALCESEINIQDFIKKARDDQKLNSGKHHIRCKSKEIKTITSITAEKTKKLILNEDIKKGRVKMEIYFAYFKSSKISVFLIAVFFMMISIASGIFTQIWLANFTSKSLYKSNSTIFFIGFGGISIIQTISSILCVLFLAFSSYFSCMFFHKKFLEGLLKSPASYFERIPIGRLLNIFSTDMSVIDDRISVTLQIFLNCFFTLIFSLVSISVKMPYILISIFFLSIFYYFLQAWYIKSSRQIRRLENISMPPIVSHIMNTYEGLNIIKSSRRQNNFISKFDNLIEFNLIPYNMNVFSNRWLGARMELISTLLILISSFSVVLASVYWFILPGFIGLILNITTSITQTLSFFIRKKCDLENDIISIERIVEYFKILPEEDPFSHIEPCTTWPSVGQICFDSYSCRYNPELPNTLHEISFKVLPNEKIGVVGRTGAGKSSLLLSLFRMIETTHGSITIDEYDISKIGIKYLRERLSVIPQDSFLFDGTFRDNVDPAHKYTDADIWDALKSSQLKKFARDLPGGLDYKIEELGKNISSGEKQLVCLTRALLKRTKILILDEATANVDLKTDRIIQEIIRKEFKNTTIITVAHRLETVMDYDKILVMDHGKIIEFDSPENLLKLNTSEFYKMVNDETQI